MIITSRYPGRCRVCSQPYAIGDRIDWIRMEPGAHEACVATPVVVHPKPRRESFRDKAWRSILTVSGIGDYDMSRADAAYMRGERPPPWDGGELDCVNEWLGLSGAKRVSGAREAFDLLTRGARTWVAILPALDILRGVPGFERARIPDEAMGAINQAASKWRNVAEMLDRVA